MANIAISVHGGAGTISRSSMDAARESLYKKALEAAIKMGYDILKKGGSSLDAVTASVVELENCPLFNAGKGSVFNHGGKHEMDAAIMRGDTHGAGAVAACRNIKNPVLLARCIMEKSNHVLLSGEGAEQFARQQNIAFEPDEYFYDEFRFRQWQELKGTEATQLDHSDKKFGTVGAVACDVRGNIAAATSTGGMTNKKFGRIGDTPLIGAGTYADNSTCAVSCTGDGEYFIRVVAAYDVAALMQYGNLSLQEAAQRVIHQKLKKLKGEGGLIAVDAQGNIEMVFNTAGMYRASLSGNHLVVSIW